MDICEGCQARDGCLSPCNRNIPPDDHEDDGCPDFANCKRIQRWLAAQKAMEAGEPQATPPAQNAEADTSGVA
jgi:predicted P-loop ATPase